MSRGNSTESRIGLLAGGTYGGPWMADTLSDLSRREVEAREDCGVDVKHAANGNATATVATARAAADVDDPIFIVLQVYVQYKHGIGLSSHVENRR